MPTNWDQRAPADSPRGDPSAHHAGYDVAVIGGGMAGVSLAAELADGPGDRLRVVVLEAEPSLAYHTTGRSAAVLLESYGGPTIRALTSASRNFYDNPSDYLTARPARPLPALEFAWPGDGEELTRRWTQVRASLPGVRLLNATQACAVQPLLQRDAVEVAMLEPDALALDVDVVHQGYLRRLRASGGAVHSSARIVGADRDQNGWEVRDESGRAWAASAIVTAAGAWAEEVAGLFGAAPIGLRALRRSAFITDLPAGLDAFPGPMISDSAERFYLKPEAGRLLCSPADETPQPPGDARPDEVAIARAIDTIGEATTLTIRHVARAWGGLRSFVADRTPVAGYDPTVPGLFWLAGQGGYGIQTAPALARVAAALVRGEPLPAEVADRGATAEALAPGRSALRG